MPWTPAEFKQKFFKDATESQATKAAEMANAMLKEGTAEGVAIATAIKHAKVSAAHDTGDEIIANAWGGEVEIS